MLEYRCSGSDLELKKKDYEIVSLKSESVKGRLSREMTIYGQKGPDQQGLMGLVRLNWG